MIFKRNKLKKQQQYINSDDIRNKCKEKFAKIFFNVKGLKMGFFKGLSSNLKNSVKNDTEDLK